MNSKTLSPERKRAAALEAAMIGAEAVASKIGYSPATVSKWMREMNIPKRSASSGSLPKGNTSSGTAGMPPAAVLPALATTPEMDDEDEFSDAEYDMCMGDAAEIMSTDAWAFWHTTIHDTPYDVKAEANAFNAMLRIQDIDETTQAISEIYKTAHTAAQAMLDNAQLQPHDRPHSSCDEHQWNTDVIEQAKDNLVNSYMDSIKTLAQHLREQYEFIDPIAVDTVIATTDELWEEQKDMLTLNLPSFRKAQALWKMIVSGGEQNDFESDLNQQLFEQASRWASKVISGAIDCLPPSDADMTAKDFLAEVEAGTQELLMGRYIDTVRQSTES